VGRLRWCFGKKRGGWNTIQKCSGVGGFNLLHLLKKKEKSIRREKRGSSKENPRDAAEGRKRRLHPQTSSACNQLGSSTYRAHGKDESVRSPPTGIRREYVRSLRTLAKEVEEPQGEDNLREGRKVVYHDTKGPLPNRKPVLREMNRNRAHRLLPPN